MIKKSLFITSLFITSLSLQARGTHQEIKIELGRAIEKCEAEAFLNALKEANNAGVETSILQSTVQLAFEKKLCDQFNSNKIQEIAIFFQQLGIDESITKELLSRVPVEKKEEVIEESGISNDTEPEEVLEPSEMVVPQNHITTEISWGGSINDSEIEGVGISHEADKKAQERNNLKKVAYVVAAAATIYGFHYLDGYFYEGEYSQQLKKIIDPYLEKLKGITFTLKQPDIADSNPTQNQTKSPDVSKQVFNGIPSQV